MSSFTNECWDAVTVSGFLTRGIIVGVLDGCKDSDSETVFDLWQRGENFVVAALRQSNNLALTQNYGDAGLNNAMERFRDKYSMPSARGVYVWQDPANVDRQTYKLNEYAASKLLSAKVDSIGHAARAAKMAKQQYGSGVRTMLDNACICFAKALTMGSITPDSVFATLRKDHPDVVDYFGLARIQSAHNGVAPQLSTSSLMKSGGGGCYVATAVYGSYDCPQVWVLRRYRDYHLAESVPGRMFIRLYYATSPTIIKLVGNTKWFNALFRDRLDALVSKLVKEGYSSAPYIDKM